MVFATKRDKQILVYLQPRVCFVDSCVYVLLCFSCCSICSAVLSLTVFTVVFGVAMLNPQVSALSTFTTRSEAITVVSLPACVCVPMPPPPLHNPSGTLLRKFSEREIGGA